MESHQLIRASAKIFGTSAIAGMGFSFGRDLYRGKKKIFNALCFLALIAAPVIGTFTSGVWLTRNYPSILNGILRRIGALLLLVPSFAALVVIGAIIVSPFFPNAPRKVVGIEIRPTIPVAADSQITDTGIEVRKAILVSKEPAPPEASRGGELFTRPQNFLFALLVLLMGLVVGFVHRKTRLYFH